MCEYNTLFEAKAGPFLKREIYEAVQTNAQIVPVSSEDIDHSQHISVGGELNALLIMNNEARREKIARLFDVLLRPDWCLHLTACGELVSVESDSWGFRFAYRNSSAEHPLPPVSFDAFWAGTGNHGIP